MSETPGRRATRSSVRGASATPAPNLGRRTRAKTPKAPTPLPAVPTGTSHAYGASGKVTLFSQVNSTVEEGSFASRFGANRVAAVSRDEDLIAPPAVPDAYSTAYRSSVPPSETNGAGLHRHRKPMATASKPANPISEENSYDREYDDDDGGGGVDDDSEDDSGSIIVVQHDRDSFTDIDTGFSYSGGASTILVPPATREEVEAARPWSLAVLWETTLRWIQIILAPWKQLHPRIKDLLLLLTIASAVLFFSTDFDSLRDRGLRFYNQAGHAISNTLHQIPSRTPVSGDWARSMRDLKDRVSTVETDLERLRQETRLDHYEIATLREFVPENVMIQKNKDTGEWELPLNFWNALREKLSEQGSSIAWETFIRTNQAKLDAAAKDAVANASPGRQVVTTETIIEHIERSVAEVEKTLHLTAVRSASSAAKRAVKDLVNATPGAEKHIRQLHDLAFANMARNTQFALYSVNYFAVGLGAAVDPSLTSTTHRKQQKGAMAEIYGSVRGLFSASSKPVFALTGWAEATDCWCAAESNEKGKAQLAVLMPRQIVPTSITIEHIPSQGTLTIGAAPKEFEVWVQNTETPKTPQPGLEYGLEGQCGTPPKDGFVCIGKAQYDIHAPSHIQNFALEAGEAVGFVNKVVIKVKNNWGMDYTCLYRVRFHGESEADIFAAEET
ncbi:hypothetical protein MBLNU459_g7369t1 [Dothideomycetes sp. NU459]